MIIKGDRCLGDVRILDVGNSFGTMTTISSFFPKKMTIERRQANFLRKRKHLSMENDFDYKKFFSAQQVNADGSYCILTPELIAEKDDGWLKKIPEDILILTKDTPGVVIGHSVSDSPVIIMSDEKNGVTALASCNAYMINSRLPLKIFLALEKEFGTISDDVKVYVSSCISEKWECEGWPSFASNKSLWNDAIRRTRIQSGCSYYSVSLRKAISNQLLGIGVNWRNIYWNMDDTLTNDNYYSTVGAKTDSNKKGRNFVGAYYPTLESENQRVKKL